MSGVYYQGFNLNLEKLLVYVKSRIPKNESKIIAEIETMLILIPQNIFVPLKKFHKHVYIKYREEINMENEEFFLTNNYNVDGDIVSILKQTYKNMNDVDKKWIKERLKALIVCIDKLIAYDPNFSSTN